MSRLLGKLRIHYRQGGVSGVSARAARFLARPFYERKDVVLLIKPACADSGPFPPFAGARNGPCEFYRGAAADVDRIGFIDARWKGWILAYLETEAELRLGRRNGQIVSYQLSHDRFMLDIPRGLRVPLGHQQVYLFDVQVAPEFRGQGIARLQLNYFETEMMRRGFKEVLSMVEIENRASLCFHDRCGFRAHRSGSYVRLAGRKSWKWGEAHPAAVTHPAAAAP